MLKVDGLTFSYRKNAPPVLKDISFEAGKGRLVAVLGPNGAGKSTLFKCILYFLKSYTGEIYIDGKNIRELSRREMARAAAYIPQTETPVFNYTVFDTVLMGTTGTLSPLKAPKAEQIRAAESAIEALGIGYMREKGVNEISGGERQLALLARAMAQNARLLIMDEPTANLDYGNQQMVLEQVKNMSEMGYTILLSTHNPEHALQYATDVLAIKNNAIIAKGPAEICLTAELIEQIYGLKVRLVDIPVNTGTIRSCVPMKGKRQQERIKEAFD